MQYMILIYDQEASWASMPESEIGAVLAQWGEFHKELAASGSMISGERLRPTSMATTIRVQNGDKTTTDGPFAETKEQLGGYYLIDVQNLDKALEWAAKIPLPEGSLEIRPVWPEGEA